ncbi:hypothetical protein BX666DRAFT_1025680 [Dichotomocladium elegans]|nr:hypothetical protein BX666DRAFT_1025680 [Dichotomocladium elegans]
MKIRGTVKLPLSTFIASIAVEQNEARERDCVRVTSKFTPGLLGFTHRKSANNSASDSSGRDNGRHRRVFQVMWLLLQCCTFGNRRNSCRTGRDSNSISSNSNDSVQHNEKDRNHPPQSNNQVSSSSATGRLATTTQSQTVTSSTTTTATTATHSLLTSNDEAATATGVDVLPKPEQPEHCSLDPSSEKDDIGVVPVTTTTPTSSPVQVSLSILELNIAPFTERGNLFF